MHMSEVRITRTEQFANSFGGMKDGIARAAISSRLVRLQHGLVGDVKSVGNETFELRIAVGAGHRVYFAQRPDDGVLLLLCGTKATQSKDIRKAKAILADERTAGRW